MIYSCEALQTSWIEEQHFLNDIYNFTSSRTTL